MKQVIVILIIGIISSVSLGLISLSFDPFLAPYSIKALFFFSLFAMIWSFLTVALFYFGGTLNIGFEKAFKNGFLISSVILGIVFLIKLINI